MSNGNVGGGRSGNNFQFENNTIKMCQHFNLIWGASYLRIMTAYVDNLSCTCVRVCLICIVYDILKNQFNAALDWLGEHSSYST